MALTTCNECGNQVSTTADFCPHCGYRFQTTKNKTIGCLLLLFRLVIYIGLAYLVLRIAMCVADVYYV